MENNNILELNDDNNKNNEFFLKCEEDNFPKKNNLSLSQNFTSHISNSFKANDNNKFKLSPKFRNSFKLNNNNYNIYKKRREKNNMNNSRKSFISKEKFWRNLDFDNKFINLIEKPQSPHNTGQYICHVHNQGKKKEKMETDNENLIGLEEGICLKGSMLNEKEIEDEMEIDLDFEDIDISLNKRKRIMSVEINYENELEKHKNCLLGKNKNENINNNQNLMEILEENK
jgi:hypothetical protein